MTSETLTLIIAYFALATVLGGLLMSWRFVTLHRDAMMGAFVGFGSALIGLGVPGVLASWLAAKPKTFGIEEAGGVPQAEGRPARFRFDSNVLWGLGAFAFMWLLLIILAANTAPSTFFIELAGGIYEGMLVFLVAAGLSIIFGLMDVLNLAQGSLFMIGAYVAWDVYGRLSGWRDSSIGLGAAFLLALLAAMGVGAIVGYGMERVFIRPTYSRPFFQIVLTFGLALVFTEIIRAQYGPASLFNLNLHFPAADPAERETILTGLFPGTKVQNYWIFMIVMGLVMMFGVQYLLQNTRIGIIVRAGVQDSQMVEALGINVRQIFTMVFALGAGIAALGGAVASGFLAPSPHIGDQFLLQAIAVVIIGGLGSYSGTAVSAIVLGIAGRVLTYFAGTELNSQALGSVAVLAILLIVLYIRPTGLFGKAH